MHGEGIEPPLSYLYGLHKCLVLRHAPGRARTLDASALFFVRNSDRVRPEGAQRILDVSVLANTRLTGVTGLLNQFWATQARWARGLGDSVNCLIGKSLSLGRTEPRQSQKRLETEFRV